MNDRNYIKALLLLLPEEGVDALEKAGLGPSTASKIINAMPEYLDLKEVEVLESLQGIGPATARKIRAGWSEKDATAAWMAVERQLAAEVEVEEAAAKAAEEEAEFARLLAEEKAARAAVMVRGLALLETNISNLNNAPLAESVPDTGLDAFLEEVAQGDFPPPWRESWDREMERRYFAQEERGQAQILAREVRGKCMEVHRHLRKKKFEEAGQVFTWLDGLVKERGMVARRALKGMSKEVTSARQAAKSVRAKIAQAEKEARERVEVEREAEKKLSAKERAQAKWVAKLASFAGIEKKVPLLVGADWGTMKGMLLSDGVITQEEAPGLRSHLNKLWRERPVWDGRFDRLVADLYDWPIWAVLGARENFYVERPPALTQKLSPELEELKKVLPKTPPKVKVKKEIKPAAPAPKTKPEPAPTPAKEALEDFDRRIAAEVRRLGAMVEDNRRTPWPYIERRMAALEAEVIAY
jgi:hypothetical protein